MDKPNKRHQTSEDEATPAEAGAPLQARSPYRPLSRRKRQEQIPEPPPAVERPVVNSRFDASPTTISAALARAAGSAEETVLVWRAFNPIEDDVAVEMSDEPDESEESEESDASGESDGSEGP